MKENFKLNEVLSLLKNLPENEANLIVEDLYNKLSFKEMADTSVYSFSKESKVTWRRICVFVIYNKKK